MKGYSVEGKPTGEMKPGESRRVAVQSVPEFDIKSKSLTLRSNGKKRLASMGVQTAALGPLCLDLLRKYER